MIEYADIVLSVLPLKKRQKNRVALVVPVRDQNDLLLRFLDALCLQTVSHDVIIVNNEPKNDLQKLLQKRSEEIVLITLNQNYGSSGGYYAGMFYAYKSQYEVIVLADVDAMPLSTDLLEEEAKALDSGSADYVMPSNPIYEACNLDEGLRRDSLGILHFLALNRQLVSKAGLYDPCLFFGMDDCEFSTRMRRFGIFRLLPRVKCLHGIGGEGPHFRYLLPVYMFRNVFIFKSRASGKLSGLDSLFRLNFLWFVYSTICKRSKLMRTLVLGLQLFNSGIMGGISYGDNTNLIGLGSMIQENTTIPKSAKIVSTLRINELVDSSTREIVPKMVGRKELIYCRADTALTYSWGQAALAHLNPFVRTVSVIGCNPDGPKVVWYTFQSLGRQKVASWMKVLTNAPFFIFFIPVIVFASLNFNDHSMTGSHLIAESYNVKPNSRQ